MPKSDTETRSRGHDWHIGDRVIDEDGCEGRVVIYYRDGDICSIENDAAHPNPRKLEDKLERGALMVK